MAKGKCTVRDCNFRVEDAPHIDGVITEMREHFRAVHPTKFFHAESWGSTIESYNLSWEELMVQMYGVGQEGMIPDRYMASEIARSRTYNDEVIARANEFMQAAAQPENANARARRRFARAGGFPAPPAMPEGILFDPVMPDRIDDEAF